MKTVQWNIDKLTPYARNPRKNDAAVDKVAASLKEFGWRQPIVVDAEGGSTPTCALHLAGQP
jgi:ParB-like chromosome segregation protein Spo0J